MKKFEIIKLYLEKLTKTKDLTLSRFVEEANIESSHFFKHFPSLTQLEREFWPTLATSCYESLVNSPDYGELNSRERIITFFYIWVENLNSLELYFKEFGLFTFLAGRFSSCKWLNDDILTLFNFCESNIKLEQKFYQFGLQKLIFSTTLFWYKDTSADRSATDELIEKSLNLTISTGEVQFASKSLELAKLFLKRYSIA